MVTLNLKVVEEEEEREVVLSEPLSLEEELTNDAPNILQRIFRLFSNVGHGADLTRFQLPALFNIPKSQLQCYGESIYCVKCDLLSKCVNGETSIDRMASIVAWSISTHRPLRFGVAPYNPILGETHHASRGTLNVLLEQVSHHPPVSALHATDEINGLEILWCQQVVPKFLGASIDAVVHGKRILNLVHKGESYVLNSPKLAIRFLPVPSVDWAGNVKIECQQTGLVADLSYRGPSFMGFGKGKRSVRGKIIDSSSLKTLYEIDGQWDRTVWIKDINNGKIKVLYDAKEVISALPTPIVRDPKGVRKTESGVVWAEVNKGILSKDWEKAREAKRAIEEKERELQRERKSKGQNWNPKHFDLSYSPQHGYDCAPKLNKVPPGPIIFPIEP